MRGILYVAFFCRIVALVLRVYLNVFRFVKSLTIADRSASSMISRQKSNKWTSAPYLINDVNSQQLSQLIVPLHLNYNASYLLSYHN